MAFAGYVCPPGTPTNEYQRPGQRNELAYCGSTCPNPCVSPPLLAAMWKSEQGNHHKGTYLSATSLANVESCARQTWFERQPGLDVYEHARRRFWPFRGTIVHALIEGADDVAAPWGWVQEIRLSVPLVYPELAAPVFDEDGHWTGDVDSLRPLTIQLGGTIDAYNPFRRWLHDFKTLSDDKLPKFLAGELGSDESTHIKASWVWQVNLYAWMLAQTRIQPEHRARFAQHGLILDGEFFPKPERLQMQLISMMEPILTATGRKYQKLRDPVEYAVDDVPLLPAAKVEAFAKDRALLWFKWLTLGQKPPVVASKQDWMCRSCPFNGELHEGEPCLPRTERRAAKAMKEANDALPG